jgi:hypothetical protein
MHKMKAKYRDIARAHEGRILILAYSVRGVSKSLVFSPVPARPSGLMCSCGNSDWNATNFGNFVHFCPDREMEVEVTDYRSVLER